MLYSRQHLRNSNLALLSTLMVSCFLYARGHRWTPYHSESQTEQQIIQSDSLIFKPLESDWSKKTLEFHAWNEKFVAHLVPENTVSPHVVSVVRDGPRSRVTHGRESLGAHCQYTGHVVSHQNSSILVSACDEMSAIIMNENHMIEIRPMNNDTHMIQRRSTNTFDVLTSFNIRNNQSFQTFMSRDSEEFCETIDDKPQIDFSIDAPETVDQKIQDPLFLQIALFTDSKLWDHFEGQFGEHRAQAELTQMALALINNVNMLYQLPNMVPKIKFEIVRFEVWKKDPDEMNEKLHKAGFAPLFLEKFCNFQASLNPGVDGEDPRHWDHAVHLSGFDIYHTTSSVAGVAPVARACDPVYSCSLVEGRHLGRSFVLTHELGHNLGMVHDGTQNACKNGCCLMSAVNGAGKTTWSDCSVREINNYVKLLGLPGFAPNCLRNDGQSLFVLDSELPGQQFTADQQCSLFWGRFYKVDLPTEVKMEEICNMLWCGNGGSTISTAHPAIEGTYCGSNQWCRGGKCVGWSVAERQLPVNGEWSAWRTDMRAECSTCRIQGSISVQKDTRVCDDPAADNGGKPCPGSYVRGMVCEGSSEPCSGFTKQNFSDAMCKSLKFSPKDPDKDLTGASFMHPTSLCRLWCRITKKDLIRSKGDLPDGTPCGLGQYCVAGECLSLSCSNKALVSNTLLDCPTVEDVYPIPSWSVWSDWSACSCWSLSQTRRRTCVVRDPATRGFCSGHPQEKQSCTPDLCDPISGVWTTWSDWSSCTAVCSGTGIRTRIRACSDPLPANEGPFCLGTSFEQQSCEGSSKDCLGPVVDGGWTEWSDWGTCSRSCGQGFTTRARFCINPLPSNGGRPCDNGEDFQVEECLVVECQDVPGFWSDWTTWTECSAACGFTKRFRQRLCDHPRPFGEGNECRGPSLNVDVCKVPHCEGGVDGGWGEWSEWSDCSGSCGHGIHIRERLCNAPSPSGGGAPCLGQGQESEPCFISSIPLCPENSDLEVFERRLNILL